MNSEALTLTNTYWNILKYLSDEVKLRLATRLTASVVTKEESMEDHTEKMLDKFFGAWEDSRSPETIIRDIKAHSSSKEPILW